MDIPAAGHHATDRVLDAANRWPRTPLVTQLRHVVLEELRGKSFSIRTLAEIEAEHRQQYRLATSGLSEAGGLALMLSAIGLYAVVAFAVGQRRNEIAIRLAIGAGAHQIVRRFVADGVRLSAAGLLIGLPISLFGLRQLRTLPDLPTISLPPVTAIATFGIVFVALAAAWLPARHAASVDPAVTLRRE